VLGTDGAFVGGKKRKKHKKYAPAGAEALKKGTPTNAGGK
jgi:hypothetical protein